MTVHPWRICLCRRTGRAKTGGDFCPRRGRGGQSVETGQKLTANQRKSVLSDERKVSYNTDTQEERKSSRSLLFSRGRVWMIEASGHSLL